MKQAIGKTESKCRACGAAMLWIKTANGRSMPVDAKPIRVMIRREGEDVFDVVSGFVSHFSTCPAAEQFRRK